MAFDRLKRWWRKITAPPAPRMGECLGRWPQPFTFVMHPSLDVDQRWAVRSALNWWDNACGVRIPCRDAYPDSPDDESLWTAVIKSAIPAGGPFVNATSEVFYQHFDLRLIHGANVELRPRVPVLRMQQIVAHEVGHVLGLGHTINPDGHLMGLDAPGWNLLPQERDYITRTVKEYIVWH